MKWFKKQSKQGEALHNPALSQPQIEDDLPSSIHSKKMLLKQLKPQCLKLCVSSNCPGLTCLCQAPTASNLQNRARSAVTTAFEIASNSASQNPLSFAKSRAQMPLWYRVKYLVILEGERVIKTGTRVSDYSRRFNTFIVAEISSCCLPSCTEIDVKISHCLMKFSPNGLFSKSRNRSRFVMYQRASLVGTVAEGWEFNAFWESTTWQSLSVVVL